ncbi:hypothetical protein H2200_006913 [Cladophialophora chaetospira]|uniref:Uncharacterized protein n=1 Tax=Cladophialophora chaetospira TaxID=386627 RepID=A0AA38X984_9EURO|nr:hypothetical protein H2200_006913 [Cladophialophora chaetospira]
MAARRPRTDRSGKPRFFDHSDLEFEVLNDTRWPRLRLPSREIISVAQAAKIYHLFVLEHSIDSVIRQFKEDFDRDISDADVEALIHLDPDQIETTDEPAGGHHIVDQPPAVAERGYIDGFVLPAGIRAEMINSRRYGVGFLRTYVHARWGLRLDLQTVADIIQEWETQTLVKIHTDPHFIIPGNARRAHEGLTLAEFTTNSRRRPMGADIMSFANPPPMYEPRPVFRGMELSHPRELCPVGGHYLPYYPKDRVPAPPSYMEGKGPPAYNMVDTTAEPIPSTAGRQSENAAGANVLTVRATSTEQASLSWQTPTSPSPQHAPSRPEPAARFSKSNVLDYLSSLIAGRIIFPNGPFEPIQIQQGAKTKIMKNYMIGRLRQRESIKTGQPLPAKDMFPSFLNSAKELSSEGMQLAKLVPAVFYELRMSSCAASRKAIIEFPSVLSLSGLFFLLNHMRLNRQELELVSYKPRALIPPVLDELRLSRSKFVLAALRKSEPTSLQELQTMLGHIRAARECNPTIRLNLFPNNEEPVCLVSDELRFSLSSLRVRQQIEASPFSGQQALIYRDQLIEGRDLVWAMHESITHNEFIMGRVALEDFIEQACKQASASKVEMEASINFIRGLRYVAHCVRIPAEWWTAVITNASLLRMVSTSRAVSVLPNRSGPFILILSARNLRRLRIWNDSIRLYPTHLSTMEALISEFQTGLHQLHQHLLDLAQLGPALHHVRRLQQAIEEHQQVLAPFTNYYQLISSSVGTLTLSDLDWVNRHHRAAVNFDERLRRLDECPVRAMLDFEVLQSAQDQYLWEIERINAWCTELTQPFPSLDEVEERMSAVEVALGSLENQRRCLELGSILRDSEGATSTTGAKLRTGEQPSVPAIITTRPVSLSSANKDHGTMSLDDVTEQPQHALSGIVSQEMLVEQAAREPSGDKSGNFGTSTSVLEPTLDVYAMANVPPTERRYGRIFNGEEQHIRKQNQRSDITRETRTARPYHIEVDASESPAIMQANTERRGSSSSLAPLLQTHQQQGLKRRFRLPCFTRRLKKLPVVASASSTELPSKDAVSQLPANADFRNRVPRPEPSSAGLLGRLRAHLTRNSNDLISRHQGHLDRSMHQPQKDHSRKSGRRLFSGRAIRDRVYHGW